MSKNNEKAQAFRYDFTPAELKAFLFHSKKCPVCGGTLKKEKTFAMAKGEDFNGKGDPFFVANATVKHYIYQFRCGKCGEVFSLQDLAEANEKK